MTPIFQLEAHLSPEFLVEDGLGGLDVDGGLALALLGHGELLVPVGGPFKDQSKEVSQTHDG